MEEGQEVRADFRGEVQIELDQKRRRHCLRELQEGHWTKNEHGGADVQKVQPPLYLSLQHPPFLPPVQTPLGLGRDGFTIAPRVAFNWFETYQHNYFQNELKPVITPFGSKASVLLKWSASVMVRGNQQLSPPGGKGETLSCQFLLTAILGT